MNELPLDLTYGTMAYDKGAVVAHTLMNYLGREAFSKAMKYYLNKFDSKSASSQDLCEALSEDTDLDMNNFFEAWVYTPGSPVYYVQHFTTTANGDKFDVNINMVQDHRGAEYIGDGVRYELTFVDSNWNMHSEMVSWDGQSANITTTLDFEPVAIFCDINNKFADACHDETFIIKQSGDNNLSEIKFKVITEEIGDSTLLRVEHRWVGPISVGEIPEGLTISDSRYWTIYRLDKGESIIKGEFQYQDNENYDANLFENENDSIVLLYRPNGACQWQSIDYILQSSSSFGRMTVEQLMSGDYVLGVWDEEYIGINEINKDLKFNIFPNPTKNEINIELQNDIKGKLVITNQLGQFVKELKINDNKLIVDVEELSPGIYYLNIFNKREKVLSEKIVVE